MVPSHIMLCQRGQGRDTGLQRMLPVLMCAVPTSLCAAADELPGPPDRPGQEADGWAHGVHDAEHCRLHDRQVRSV